MASESTQEDKNHPKIQEYLPYNLASDTDVDTVPSFHGFDSATTHIEEFSTSLCQSIYDTLDQVCGKKDRVMTFI